MPCTELSYSFSNSEKKIAYLSSVFKYLQCIFSKENQNMEAALLKAISKFKLIKYCIHVMIQLQWVLHGLLLALWQELLLLLLL